MPKSKVEPSKPALARLDPDTFDRVEKLGVVTRAGNSGILRAALALALRALEARPDAVKMIEAGLLEKQPNYFIVQRFAEFLGVGIVLSESAQDPSGLSSTAGIASDTLSDELVKVAAERSDERFEKRADALTQKILVSLRAARERTFVLIDGNRKVPITFSEDAWKRIQATAKRAGVPLDEALPRIVSASASLYEESLYAPYRNEKNPAAPLATAGQVPEKAKPKLAKGKK